jgi:hypothetical protein
VSVVVGFHLNVAAVDADYLSIDPATLWTGEKRDDANDIFDLTKPSEGSHLADGCDQLKQAVVLGVSVRFRRAHVAHGSFSDIVGFSGHVRFAFNHGRRQDIL